VAAMAALALITGGAAAAAVTAMPCRAPLTCSRDPVSCAIAVLLTRFRLHMLRD
jgi:hypothetical protein